MQICLCLRSNYVFFSFLYEWCEDYDDDIQVSHDADDGDNNRDDDDNHGDW